MANKTVRIAGIALLAAALIGGAATFGIHLIKTISPRHTFTSDSGAKVYCEELSFYTGNGKIYGKVYKPQDTLGRKNVLIYCHDIGGNLNDGKAFCEAAARKGLVAYSFDFMGGSPESRSDGNLRDMSVRTEADNLKEVIGRINKEDFAKKRSIYLVGYGMGGAVAAIAASELKKETAGIVLIASMFNIKEYSTETYPKARNIQDTTFVNGVPVGKKFFTDSRDLNIFRKMKKFNGPALIIHGIADNISPIGFAEKANKALSGARLERIQGAGHNFSGSEMTKAQRLALEFILSDAENK